MKLTFFWAASCASTCPSCLSNCSFTSATWKGFSPNWESAPPPSRPKDPTFPLGASSFLLSPSLQRSPAPSPKPLSVLLSSVPAHHPFGIIQIFKKWCLTALPLLSFAFEFLDAFLYVLLELVIFFQFIFHLLLNEHLREKKTQNERMRPGRLWRSPPSAGSAPLALAEPPVGSSFVKVASPFIAGGQMEGGRDIYVHITWISLVFKDRFQVESTGWNPLHRNCIAVLLWEPMISWILLQLFKETHLGLENCNFVIDFAIFAFNNNNILIVRS